ncbi:uncharacterized protein L969DRAFT_18198 [Mixia osmundae IAM 14324]|uniref:uncharacterized protein n=1 Tax=Mixia osmundae (strain CBS 9802 / IAM 14324 / JCM 22182 / KY 12970) TaxID=764103 RepID=UPI0004A54991|nr:uncharacterized protein L969DRAFT_18198 [Mixia osmundae IAM 14324]KEI39129.1 hypothetical protein L969DRAFT_18198 [Mixia osmundae IAM 14324]
MTGYAIPDHLPPGAAFSNRLKLADVTSMSNINAAYTDLMQVVARWKDDNAALVKARFMLRAILTWAGLSSGQWAAIVSKDQLAFNVTAFDDHTLWLDGGKGVSYYSQLQVEGFFIHYAPARVRFSVRPKDIEMARCCDADILLDIDIPLESDGEDDNLMWRSHTRPTSVIARIYGQIQRIC